MVVTWDGIFSRKEAAGEAMLEHKPDVRAAG
jgi:hypothetical protein